MGIFRDYQNKLQNKINISEPPSWSELTENFCDFMQRPSILITLLLLIVLIYLSAQNGAMERELNDMHNKLDKFENKEARLSN